MPVAILNDLTRCIGCEACVWACKEVNDLPREDGGRVLSATTWTAVERRGEVHVRRQCMHCLDPACVSVCPVGALQKTEAGPIVYDASRCIGCRYCMIGCPFDVPKYEWDRPLPLVRKCILCHEQRLSRGLQPACTAACPTGASVFGERDELLAEAGRRMRAEPARYVPHVYGEREAGGTTVLYLSAVPFEKLGFRSLSQTDPYPRLTWDILSRLPRVVGIGAVLLAGIWWLAGRKETLAQLERGELTLEEAMQRRPPLTRRSGRTPRAAAGTRGRGDHGQGDSAG